VRLFDGRGDLPEGEGKGGEALSRQRAEILRKGSKRTFCKSSLSGRGGGGGKSITGGGTTWGKGC